MLRVPMQVQHFQTNSLSRLPQPEERRLLLWSMVALNELNLLYACVATSFTDPGIPPVGLASQNQTLFFLTLLAGSWRGLGCV